jgi:hypothetical protein
VEAGVGVGQQVPDDHQDGTADRDDGVLGTAAAGDAPVALPRERCRCPLTSLMRGLPGTTNCCLRAPVSASPVRSANLVAPGPRRPRATGRPGRGPWRPGRRPWDQTTSRSEGYGGVAAPGHPAPGVRLAALPREGHADARLDKGYPLYGNDVHERWVGTRARLRGRHSGSEVVSNVTVSEGHTVGKMLAVAYAESFHAGHRTGSGRQGKAEGGDGHNDPVLRPAGHAAQGPRPLPVRTRAPGRRGAGTARA